MTRQSSPRILFNASVVLAGIKSPRGGSGKLLSMVRKKKITGIISETIEDEILRNFEKIGLGEGSLAKKVKSIFNEILQAPQKDTVDDFKEIVLDFGDAHVLASARESKADFLVTLDQKHLLVLKREIKEFKILSPAEFLQKILPT